MLLGWEGEGDLDAHESHLAKLRTIQRYLNKFGPESADDLILIVDGFDVLFQVPVEVLIERYFNVVEMSEERLGERLGMKASELHELGMRQTIFWGPAKVCFPGDTTAVRCWGAPDSGLPDDIWGPTNKKRSRRDCRSQVLELGNCYGPS